MNFLTTPKWMDYHRFTYNNWTEVPKTRLETIQNGLKRLSHTNPMVTICIPVWNEAETLLNTLSSLSAMHVPYPTELIFVNNNSTDATQDILDFMGINTLHQPKQGIAHARLMGLENSRGQYTLCGDGDSIYPPHWIEEMVLPLILDSNIKCTYGLHAYVPDGKNKRWTLSMYEMIAKAMVYIRKVKREFINVHGFNMAFRTQEGLEVKGFDMPLTRTFDSDPKKGNFVIYGEDGRMGRKMSEIGKLKLVSANGATVWTSSRRLMKDGNLWHAFTKRIVQEGKMVLTYLFGPKKPVHTTDDLIKHSHS